MNPQTPGATSPSRIVLCEDAIAWLGKSPQLHGHSFVTSLPDISEFPNLPLPAWKAWFMDAAKLILSRCGDEGVSVFYQSDIRVDGGWVDKGYLCSKAAEEAGHQLIWHKIISRVPPGTPTAGRPSYTHALCFSRLLPKTPEEPSPDIIAEPGEKTWERGMGLNAALLIGRYIARHTETRTVVNPFCGQGSMLAAANAVGLSAIGIERSPKRAELARTLSVAPDLQSWRN